VIFMPPRLARMEDQEYNKQRSTKMTPPSWLSSLQRSLHCAGTPAGQAPGSRQQEATVLFW
jgi:hypothetical protein